MENIGKPRSAQLGDILNYGVAREDRRSAECASSSTGRARATVVKKNAVQYITEQRFLIVSFFNIPGFVEGWDSPLFH